MYRKYIILTGLCVSLFFCGCTGAKNVTQNIMEEMPETEAEEMKEIPEEIALGEEEEEMQPELLHETIHAQTILEDDAYVYICGIKDILKVDKDTQEAVKIWESVGKSYDKPEEYKYYGTSGILLNDKIYFMESWLDNDENAAMGAMVFSLAVVNTDGSGYREIERITDGDYQNLLLLDGILYFARNDETNALKGYATDASGDLVEGMIITEPVNLSENYSEIYYSQNGNQILSPVESVYQFGYYLVRNGDYDICIVDQNTGEEKALPGDLKNCSMTGWNNNFFLFTDMSDEKMYLIDRSSMEIVSRLFDYSSYGGEESYINVFSMDDEYAYWRREVVADTYTQYFYERIDLTKGIVEELFVLDEMTGMPDGGNSYLLDMTACHGYIYYVTSQDYKYYLARRHVDMPNAEELLGEAFYDSGISEIGRIESYKEVIYSDTDPELKLAEIDLEWLVLDSRYPGADKINAELKGDQQKNIAYEQESALMIEEWIREEGIGISYSYSSNVSQIYYFDNNYLSFVQQEYDYTGGAHGMPFWIPCTFDLNSGERLALSDIIGNSEEELKVLARDMFTEIYNASPDAYWQNAVESVYEWTTLESPFYLEEEGVVIYFAPYDLAAYAFGFQEILIPYGKLEMKITIGS